MKTRINEMKVALQTIGAIGAGFVVWLCAIAVYAAFFVPPCPPGSPCAMGLIGVIVIGVPVASFAGGLSIGALLPASLRIVGAAVLCVSGLLICALVSVRWPPDRVFATLGLAYVAAPAAGILIGYGCRRWLIPRMKT